MELNSWLRLHIFIIFKSFYIFNLLIVPSIKSSSVMLSIRVSDPLKEQMWDTDSNQLLLVSCLEPDGEKKKKKIYSPSPCTRCFFSQFLFSHKKGLSAPWAHVSSTILSGQKSTYAILSHTFSRAWRHISCTFLQHLWLLSMGPRQPFCPVSWVEHRLGMTTHKTQT